MTSLLTVLSLFACGTEDAKNVDDLVPADLSEASRTKDAGGVNGVWDYCDGAVTCDLGEGDCENDAQCTAPLVCGDNNASQFGFHWSYEVCVPDHCTNGVLDAADGETGIDFGGDCGSTCTGTNGDEEGFCTPGCPCDEGEGDCDTDDECATGLRCTGDQGGAYGLSANLDVCRPLLTAADLQPGDLLITEVMQDPAVTGDGDGEFFEVFNNSGHFVNLDGLEVRDDGTNNFTVAAPSLELAPNGHALFAKRNPPTGGFTRVPDYLFPNAFQLANGDDEIVLETPAGVEITRVAWDGGPNWPDPTGASMQLDPASLAYPGRGYQQDNNDPANWCVSVTRMSGGDLGTPGRWNSECP